MPPTKRTKGEKANKTPKSTEADETMENAQEESVDYKKFYNEFIPRALNTIRDKFDFIQDRIDKHGMVSQIENIRSVTGYIDMLQKMLILVQQIEMKDRRKQKND